MSTYDGRVRRGRALCARLTGEITRVAVPGLRLSSETQAIIGPPEADFIELLTRWERSGDPHLFEQRVLPAYARLVDAWKDAARLYETRGKVS